MKKLLIIDTFNFLHRAYHALPRTFTDREGNPTNAIYGVTSMLISIFDELKPDYALAAVDEAAPTLRHEDFTGYKAHRRPMEDDLASQIDKVFEVIDAFGVKRVSVPGYEADDVIGTAAEKFKHEDAEVVISSNDRDLWQLINGKVMVMMATTKGAVEWVGEKEVIARMGFLPRQVIDYKGLRGDPSDNIPGVYGVGEKTATSLIAEFDNIDNIYAQIDKVKPDSLRKKLAENYEQALMSRQLATIIRDVPFDLRLEECAYSELNREKIKEVLEKHNFKSLLKRMGFEVEVSSNSSKKQDVPQGQMSLL